MNDTELQKPQSVELIRSGLHLEITRLGLNYQKMLQDAQDIEFSKESLNQDYEPLKKLRELSGKLKSFKNPYTQAWKNWNQAMASLCAPVEQILEDKTKDFEKLAQEIADENRKAALDSQRLQEIRNSIGNTLSDYSILIAQAENNQQLIEIERNLNLEATRTSKWGEFLHEFQQRSKAIRDLLAAKKEKIRELTKLDQKQPETASDEATIALQDRRTDLAKEIHEKNQQVQEKAMESLPVLETPVLTLLEVKARRTTWDFEVSDLYLFQRRHPGLVDLMLNAPKVGKWVSEIVEELKKANLTEKTVDGIRIYQKKFY